ncbi:hypothetical protein ACN6LA_007797 [Streptomyces sp. SAS_269]|uniref:hypothetical protein n=1 Tax=Streptomyces sp. SAS_269 TaxID=3412749 RepID=UPI00403CA6DD
MGACHQKEGHAEGQQRHGGVGAHGRVGTGHAPQDIDIENPAGQARRAQRSGHQGGDLSHSTSSVQGGLLVRQFHGLHRVERIGQIARLLLFLHRILAILFFMGKQLNKH